MGADIFVGLVLFGAALLILGLVAAIIRAMLLWYWRINEVVSLLEQILAKLSAAPAPNPVSAIVASVPAARAVVPRERCHFCGERESNAGVYQGQPICSACAGSFEKV